MGTLSVGTLTPQKIVLGALLVLSFGVFLERFGLLEYSVGFLLGIVFTLIIEAVAIYYFIIKIEKKADMRLAEFVQIPRRHVRG